jgi:Mannitol-1-phosphate/altronate dehydrogenases
MTSKLKKLVLFGAGKIGRSFIGQLFSRSGYEVVFIDIDQRVIDALNQKHSYKVFICDTNPGTIVVDNVRGVQGNDVEKVVNEIVSADVLAVSVGKNGLKHIVPTLSHGLVAREKAYPGRMIDIILAENMRNADVFLHDELTKVLPESYPLDQRVGLVETSIGKMVPLVLNHQDNDILSVYAEAYNTLIVNKKAFKNSIPVIAGMEAKENMKAWVDRKLFIHNFGHAAAAYLGYKHHPELTFLWEVLEDEKIRTFVRKAMQQSATALQNEYPDVFSTEHLQEHINDLIQRFSNRSLGDTVFRVGCDLYRKLSFDDRIITPLMSAYKNGLPYNMILKVLASALRFKATGIDGKMYPADMEFHGRLKEYGTLYVFEKVCGFTECEAIQFLNQINETNEYE